MENLSYIPGEVGASAVQNIGAYGVEVKDVIRTVYCYDTVEEEFVNFDVSECEYGYRDSVFKDPEIKGRYIVTHVVFALSRTPQPRLEYGHLKEAVLSASVRECHSVPETPSQVNLGPSPEPAAAGFSLQRSTGPFAYRSRGWQNANSAQIPPVKIRVNQDADEAKDKVSAGSGAAVFDGGGGGVCAA